MQPLQRPLALAPLSLLPAGPVEQFDAAAAAGFAATGLRVVPVMATDPVFVDDVRVARELQARVRDRQIEVLDIEVFRIGPTTHVEDAEPALAFGAALGARHALCTFLLRTEGQPQDEEASVDKLVAFCDLAARYRIRPMLEFMSFRLVGTLADAVRVTHQARHPNLGICVDALHLFRSGGTPAQVRDLPAALLPYAQWCDAPFSMPSALEIPREARFNRLMPGQGGLPLQELLSALPQRTALSVEVPQAGRSSRSVMEAAQVLGDSMRAWLARAGEA